MYAEEELKQGSAFRLTACTDDHEASSYKASHASVDYFVDLCQNTHL